MNNIENFGPYFSEHALYVYFDDPIINYVRKMISAHFENPTKNINALWAVCKEF
jgi:hypothetical protein